jgi:thiamine-monophosphate kinase
LLGASPARSSTLVQESAITLSELGEFGLIRRLTADLPRTDVTILGPGDDAAVMAAPDGRVVATVDLLIEGRHFRRDWSSAEDVGHKAAARSFADVAAMGAVPTALLVGFGAPPELEVGWADGLMNGLRDEAGSVGAAIIGGDLTAAEQITIAVTALGDLQGRPPLTLAGARDGDVVAVAGRLGWAAAGFAVLSRGFRSPVQVVAAHRRPEPPYDAGPAAHALGATSLTDVSDGLIADLGHVAAASGVRIDLRTDLIEAPVKLREVGAALNADPMVWLLTGGDDYAMAATFPAGTDLGPDWSIVGSVSAGEGVRVDGRKWQTGGHEHFRP